MLTRRAMLRSAALAGTTIAAPAVLAGCGSDRGSGPAPPTSAAAHSVGLARARVPRSIGGSGSLPDAVRAVQAFTVDLYQQLAAAQPGNVICSPYSVAVALAMTRNGARGQTATEMDDVLHAPDLARFNAGLNALTRLVESRAGRTKRGDGSKATISVDVANSLWGQRDVAWTPAFLETLARYYGAGMHVVDYDSDVEAARLAINGWTSVKTHDKIPKLLPPGILDALTRLVLVNAIYLKAPWEQPFAKGLTTARPFRLADGSKIATQTMQGSVQVMASSGPGWRSARLAYAGGKLALTVVVPASSLSDLEGALTADSIRAMLSTRGAERGFQVSLPKWTFRLPSALADPLATLGMPTAFDPVRADFREMTAELALYISAVQHEAFIAVDEDGTEAAAATAVVMEETSAEATPSAFVVDRPFLYVIHDVETETPLFIGRVTDPRHA